ncbi:Fic family protein, partial [Halodesulfovibrio sp.]|uniref:Fic family protein n=1 Tax=Halodesulfovibrio sp. TaxID=1912772 RepID=UPI0025FFFDE9
GTERALFATRKMLSELVYNMTTAEGNPLSAVEVETIVHGTSVGGVKISDVEQTRRIQKGWEEVTSQVQAGTFQVNKDNFVHINSIVATDEAPVGGFRTGSVRVGNIPYAPPSHEYLDKNFEKMLWDFNQKKDTEEKSYDLFLDSARNQFFWDGNKRTAQFMMNGYRLKEGLPVISFDPSVQKEYFGKMARFYINNDKKEMYDFLGKRQAQIDLEQHGSDNLSEQKENLRPLSTLERVRLSTSIKGVPGLGKVKQQLDKISEIETELSTMSDSEREKRIAEYEALFKTQKGRGVER